MQKTEIEHPRIRLPRQDRERDILESLEHPGVIALLGEGAYDGKPPFFVLTFCDGTRLDRFADERCLTLNDRCNLFLRVYAAVKYVHDHSVVHCDLNPSNVLVTGDGMVKVIDFGSRFMKGRPGHSGMGDEHRGTPQYMSPEQSGPSFRSGPNCTDCFSPSLAKRAPSISNGPSSTAPACVRSRGGGAYGSEPHGPCQGWLQAACADRWRRDSAGRQNHARQHTRRSNGTPIADEPAPDCRAQRTPTHQTKTLARRRRIRLGCSGGVGGVARNSAAPRTTRKRTFSRQRPRQDTLRRRTHVELVRQLPKGCESAAMIGYVQDMDPDATLTDVNKFATPRKLPSLKKAAAGWVAKSVTRLDQDPVNRNFDTNPLNLRHLWVDLRQCKFETPQPANPALGKKASVKKATTKKTAKTTKKTAN